MNSPWYCHQCGRWMDPSYAASHTLSHARPNIGSHKLVFDEQQFYVVAKLFIFFWPKFFKVVCYGVFFYSLPLLFLGEKPKDNIFWYFAFLPLIALSFQYYRKKLRGVLNGLLWIFGSMFLSELLILQNHRLTGEFSNNLHFSTFIVLFSITTTILIYLITILLTLHKYKIRLIRKLRLANNDWINYSSNIRFPLAFSEARRANNLVLALIFMVSLIVTGIWANVDIHTPSAKTTSITCIKNKVTKEITSAKPKCPTGYKVKK